MSAVNNQSGCEPQNLGKSRSVVFYERLRSRFIFYMLQIMPAEYKEIFIKSNTYMWLISESLKI